MLVRQDFAQLIKRKWGENLSLFKKLLGIGNYWSHHWKLHVNSFYWALDHPRFLLSHQRLVLLSLLPDMKSCRALTLHFVWYPKKNKWDKSEQSGISNFSAHRTDWPFRLRPASKPGCAAMCVHVLVSKVAILIQLKFLTFYAWLTALNGRCFIHFCCFYNSPKSCTPPLTNPILLERPSS